jgi:DNA ligase-1
MKFEKLSKYLDKLESTASRIEMTKILSEVFRKSSKDEIEETVNLLLGQLAPNYEGIVFNIAERMMVDVIANAYDVDKSQARKVYKKLGDLGDTAYELARKSKATSSKSKLSIVEVYKKLLDIAQDEGEGSQERKIKDMAKLLSRLDPLSARYVARIPVGKLRLGFSDKTIIDALSWMEVGNKSKSSKLKRAYEVVPNIGELVREVKKLGIDRASQNIKPKVDVPVLPMLAQRLKSPSEMIKKMGKVNVEPKFDGLRVLIHFKRGKKQDLVKAYTRNLNNVYEMFPELADAGKYIKADSVILDSEAVGLDPQEKKIASFQTTMKRRRKHNIADTAKKIPLRFQVFDIIFKDGKSLMQTSYVKRRSILEKSLKPNDLLVIDETIPTDKADVINEEYRKRIAEGLEGIIVKKSDANYVPGRTGYRWVKMKEEEKALGKLADTVDCIVMAYYVGRGKRASFGVGGFLVGVNKGEKILTLTKIGTGLTDEQFRQLYKRLKKIEVGKKPREYGKVDRTLDPDVWVQPSLVVEIAADEITKSPIHSSGYALRFPRLVRFRDDKDAEQATTVSEVKKLYEMQKSQ